MILAVLVGHAGVGKARAQNAAPDTTRHPECAVIPDTARNVPRPEQIRERIALRDTLVRIGRRYGVAQPAGLLFVAVDTGTMHGAVRFLESNLPGPAIDEATRLVERYLSELAPGRGFQMLVRIDGDYPAPLPGRRLCQPTPDEGSGRTESELHRAIRIVIEHHPDPERAALAHPAVLRLVVSRTGEVVFVLVERGTGDAFYDGYLSELGRRMRFHPATLDGRPFDTRVRFTVAFTQ
ncbi:MAG: hypothetical protein JWM27_3587 [Gemmatimonadetes bacterium]|nr:hypothetical protein [Gemmatimonadota bacterium]